jgi:peptide-methionine (S)-S-oxide reductase
MKATLAGGCFWCTEAIYKRLKGVNSIIPGYSGGTTPNPSYEDVCAGTTGHAEAIQIDYDPKQISFDSLLDIFWHTHDPTTLNRQGNDTGTQYRSAIFFHDENQRKKAETSKQALVKSHDYNNSIVTEITKFEKFYPAENYHKDYYDRNKQAGYCSIIIAPKIQKLINKYSKFLKEEYIKE